MNTLHQEILEQPQRIHDLLTCCAPSVQAYANDFRQRDVQSLTMVARGTSHNAALYGVYLFGSQNQLPVQVLHLGLTSFLGVLPVHSSASILGISQSGSSKDLCQIMERLNAMGRLTLGVTNVSTGRMSLFTDHVFDIQAGPEKATAATKSFTNQLVALACLSQGLRKTDDYQEQLKQLPLVAQATLDCEPEIRRVAMELASIRDLLVVGRGFNHVVVAETALKMQEICYIRALPFTSADFLHGPIALLDENSVMLCIDAGLQYNNHFETIRQQVKETGGKIVAVSSHPERWPDAFHFLQLPRKSDLPDFLCPIPAMLTCQLLALHLGLAKGLNVSNPRYLVKETSTD